MRISYIKNQIFKFINIVRERNNNAKCLYFDMHGIITMKRNTCVKPEYVDNAKPR